MLLRSSCAYFIPLFLKSFTKSANPFKGTMIDELIVKLDRAAVNSQLTNI
jgi:hypothetical protein